MLAGEVGLVSMGHAGVSAAAAYAVAWAVREQMDLGSQLLLALVVTLLVSAVYGLTAMRTSGLVFLMITLALGMVVYGLALKWSTVTGRPERAHRDPPARLARATPGRSTTSPCRVRRRARCCSPSSPGHRSA